jgi:hypothetical protein
MGKYRWQRLIAITVCAFVASHCQPLGPQGRHIEWEYLIPDNYTGYLAIQYNCPNGVPLNIQNNMVRITFKLDGTYCTSDSYTASWSSDDKAWNAGGTPVPLVDAPSNQQGYGLCCGSTLVAGVGADANTGQEFVFFIQWVGDMARVNASWPTLPDNMDNFLENRFGIPASLSQQNATPTP